ncbi:5-aminolevulic acid synthase [Rhodovulum strictum]|uniref:5-aminolevulic acid synthase n=1 Tax=Rhodovulum strictum TaxID=58314 RepID=A0A844B9N3_9RHOB|nr:5-aminolevulic acid synthase [Rhodovulum strictum]MRH19378.1 5-aminolevulic acid synthase [Rhodovulum strictum]
MRAILLGLVTALAASTASAEPLDGATARAQIFEPSGVEVTVMALDFLSAKDRTVLDFVATQQKYYGAIAAAPGEGLRSEATVAAANYHDVESARIAALKGCDSVRKGGPACVIVAEIRPIGWTPRQISLSADASEGLRKTYRPARGAKALAISPATGIWAVARGAEAGRDAVASCARQSARDDCRVVVADR